MYYNHHLAETTLNACDGDVPKALNILLDEAASMGSGCEVFDEDAGCHYSDASKASSSTASEPSCSYARRLSFACAFCYVALWSGGLVFNGDARMTSVMTAMAETLMAATGEEEGQSSGKEIRTFPVSWTSICERFLIIN